MLIHYTWLRLMLVQLCISSWLGTRWGAVACMRILVPLGFFGYYFEWITTSQARTPVLSVSQVQMETARSLLSFLMVFSFAVPYFVLLKVLAPRMRRGVGTVATALGATASAVGLRYVYSEGLELLRGLSPASQHAIATVIAIALMIGAHFAFRSGRVDDRVPAHCSLWNGLVRVLTLSAILWLLDRPEVVQGSPALWMLAWVLSALPRLTLELVAGTQSANGPRSAEAVLAGLPLGLTPDVMFCVAFPLLAGWTELWPRMGRPLRSVSAASHRCCPR